jgi:hypothetical protein
MSLDLPTLFVIAAFVSAVAGFLRNVSFARDGLLQRHSPTAAIFRTAHKRYCV